MTSHAGLMSKKLMNTSAAAAAAAVLAIGAYLLGTGQSDSTASTAGAGNGAAQQGGHGFGGQPPSGAQRPPGFRPGGGMGTDVTADVAQKVEEAVAAKYDGDIERVQQLDDGSYLAHLITNDAQIYVAVSKSFDVAGAHERPLRGMPQGGAAQGAQSGTGAMTS
jgi:hypothetical protein